MGVNACSSFLYKSVPLSIDQLKEVLYTLSKENAREEDKIVMAAAGGEAIIKTTEYRPSIIIDANNVGFKDCQNPEVFNMRLAKSLRKIGSKVLLVADNEERHFSKRASSVRCVERELSRIKAIHLERELSILRHNNKNEDNHHEVAALAKRVELYKQKSIRSLPANFAHNLMLQVECADDDYITFQKAHLQADPLIARNSIKRSSDLIWSNDSDFIFHNPASQNMELQDSVSLKGINPIVLQKAGLDVHLSPTLLMKIPKRKLVSSTTSSKQRKMMYHISENIESKREPAFSLHDLTPNEIKRLTGFQDLVHLLSFVLVVCDGNISKMTMGRVSKMTWLEEWVFYFEYLYGRVHSRWEDYEKQWNLRRKTLRDVLISKLGLVVKTRLRWPKFTSLTEDEALRKPHWNSMLKEGQRVRMIMHDMTNIPLMQPSDAELNRSLWNTYYNQCCGKGGIFTQLCGWEGTLELYVGSTGDSEYIRKTNILSVQEEFSKSDKLIDGKILPFLNVFDKGYRVLLDCFRHGEQMCWQPAFARSDERYGSYATLHTGTVAYTRSGNERSVKHMKHSWLIKRGAVGMPKMDLGLLSDIWLAWGFQVNFMYDPVH